MAKLPLMINSVTHNMHLIATTLAGCAGEMVRH